MPEFGEFCDKLLATQSEQLLEDGGVRKEHIGEVRRIVNLVSTASDVAPISLCSDTELFQVGIQIRIVSFVFCASADLIVEIYLTEEFFDFGGQCLPVSLCDRLPGIRVGRDCRYDALNVVNHPSGYPIVPIEVGL